MFRIGLGAELFEAALSADFEKFESTRGQQKLEGARGNIYYGNDTGIEAFLGEFENAAIALAGLIVYSVLMGRINFWVLLLLFGSSGVIMAVNFYGDQRTVKQLYDGFPGADEDGERSCRRKHSRGEASGRRV